MKKITLKRKAIIFSNFLLTIVIWSAFVYGSISFYYWNGNPQQWEPGGRFLMVLLGFVIGLIISVGVSVEINDTLTRSNSAG